MKAVSVANLKKELKHKSDAEKTELILRLARFKKENKELLTYLLFEQDYEAGYIEAVKYELDEMFTQINTSSMYFIKKSIRKILRTAKKYIRYSKIKETEIEILMHFCQEVYAFTPSVKRTLAMMNLVDRQLALIAKAIDTLHEDLQYDYNKQLEELRA